jgi:solute carrier family 35 protein E1
VLHGGGPACRPGSLTAPRPAPHQARAPARLSPVNTQASASDAADAPAAPAGASPARVSAYIFGWYAFNIVFNILNKSLLNVFPAPWFIATFQLSE